MTGKIWKIYFPSKVQSAWIVMPSIQTVQLFLPDQPVLNFTDCVFTDPVTAISINTGALFQ